MHCRAAAQRQVSKERAPEGPNNDASIDTRRMRCQVFVASGTGGRRPGGESPGGGARPPFRRAPFGAASCPVPRPTSAASASPGSSAAAAFEGWGVSSEVRVECFGFRIECGVLRVQYSDCAV